MLKGMTSLFPGRGLTEAQRRMYRLEKEENFRWIARILAKPAPEPLHSSDLVDPVLQEEISDIGQFAEIAHGTINPEFIWEHVSHLSEPDYPLRLYRALDGSTLLDVFHGSVANLQGYIAYRSEAKQVIVAFSGTSAAAQAVKTVQFTLVQHPSGGGCRVHSGFWSMYVGIRDVAMSSLQKALKEHEVRDVVITGHSMGGVIGSFFCLDVLGESGTVSEDQSLSLTGKVKLVIFGSPRFGNTAFSKHFQDAVDRHQVKEQSIRIYNDGVPQMPPSLVGYRHVSRTPFYFAYGRLWRISPSQIEYSLFKFDPQAIEDAVDSFPLGGHNYYNSRDMELLQRRIKWFHPITRGELWETLKARFHQKLLEEQKTHGGG
ncbi:Alpha/Beta hydrolase protein [Gymnopilus junonius]|uniref:Alpha/Beta hydrolase protein n=1 Tax=Gymnopilus junonius TaxID=109634 RepID=A0A9P5NSK0_GYMJU|nr:Alpha/Beta hydrolase protein [Gymnopilus junonius]